MEELEQLKYPIGRFSPPSQSDQEQIQLWIAELAAFPKKLQEAVLQLSAPQLDAAYRPGGWTLRQVVHHLADSHMNAYIRFKLALTEDNPTIRPYFEDRWAKTTDARTVPIGMSVDLLSALHQRWTGLLLGMTPDEFKRTYFHPENGRVYQLDEVLALYVWHGNHHLCHIVYTKQRSGW